MPSTLRPSPNDRPEPQFAGPGAAPRREPATARPPARGEDGGAVASLRLLGAARQGEPPAPPAFTAGERLTVSSVLAGGDGRPRRRLGMFRLSLLLVLLFFAGIGAVTVYHAVAGVLPG
ncbi:MAG TPA: hypothetical protein VF113_06160 [Stellaceae bacterium]